METFEKLFVGILLTAYFIGFVIKNIVTKNRIKQRIKGNSIKVNLLIVNSTLLSLLTYFCIFFNPAHLLWIHTFDFAIVKIAGIILTAMAFILGISTLVNIKDSWRVGIRPEQKTDLIANGNFIFSRNPYFLSYDLMYLGIFLIFPTFVYLLLYLIFIVIIHLMILDEEKYLTKQHGDSYLKYKNSVNRYFTLKLKK
jgi:protein-S-isoprenylcysteine O-methyltransferase Ste14